MQILVLGGTGWLGRHVAETALLRGHAVTVTSRGLRADAPLGARHVTLDRSTAGAMREIAQHPWDAVVDVGMQPAQVRESAVALAGRRTRYAFISSCSVYAAHDVLGATESAALLPAFEADAFERMEDYGSAKVACEQAVQATYGDRALLVRPGLIAGPGDRSDRTGYWPLRFHRNADAPVLVPDDLGQATQIIDVRDLAAWVVAAIEQGLHGEYDAVGPSHPLRGHLDAARRAAAGTGSMVEVAVQWLVEQEVAPWSGPRSLPLWIGQPEWRGFMARSGERARATGLICRAVEATYRDTLAWELQRSDSPRRLAGLTDDEERSLLAVWGQQPSR